MFRPPGDIRLDARFCQRAPQRAHCQRDETLAVRATFVDQLGDALVDVRMQVPECEILELPLELPDAEPVRQRRVDVGGQLCQRLPLFSRSLHGVAHARELTRQQDEHDAQVADDREQQAAQSFGVPGAGARRIQRPDFLGRLLAFGEIAHARCLTHDRVERNGDAGLEQRVQDARGERFGIGAQLFQQSERIEQLGLEDPQRGVVAGRHHDFSQARTQSRGSGRDYMLVEPAAQAARAGICRFHAATLACDDGRNNPASAKRVRSAQAQGFTSTRNCVGLVAAVSLFGNGGGEAPCILSVNVTVQSSEPAVAGLLNTKLMS